MAFFFAITLAVKCIVDGTFLFTANAGVKGRELWKSDGDAVGVGTLRLSQFFTGDSPHRF